MTENKTYKIRIYSSFSNPKIYKDIYERLYQTHLLDFYGKDKKVYITNDNDFTHVFIFNTATPSLPAHIPKENVIGLAFEPNVYLNLTSKFIEYAKKNIGKYFIGDKLNLPDPFYEHHGYLLHVAPLKPIPDKTKLISIILSEKRQQVGHQYRHTLVERILKDGLPVDIYGRGCRFYRRYIESGNQRIKGNFEKYEPYEQYQFHITIENVRLNHYFSEKISNALLCGSTPLYLGCKKIDSYFPEQVIHLTGDASKDILLIRKIIKEPEKFRKEIDVQKSLETISILHNIDKVFSK